MPVTVFLNQNEIYVLDRQPYASKSKGGWQGLIVSLRERIDRSTGRLVIDPRTLERISRYAFDYGNGGWESRLRRIFSRTLGPMLGRLPHAA